MVMYKYHLTTTLSGNEYDAEVLQIVLSNLVECYCYRANGSHLITYTVEYTFEANSEIEADEIMQQYIDLVYDSSTPPDYVKVHEITGQELPVNKQ